MPRGLRRFFVDSPFPGLGALVKLSSHETFHLHRVLRLKVGDSCEIFNRAGQGASATVESFTETGNARLHLNTISSLQQRTQLIKIAQALPQKRKMDRLVDWVSEFGIQELWVTETKRTIVKMKGEARERARRRWERIAVEACKQSGSPVLTKIEGPCAFEKIIEEKIEPSERKFIFHPDPNGLSFADLVADLQQSKAKGNASPVFLFFGPEGGFTEEEVRQAEARGVQKVFLGDSLLRLEVALAGVLGALRFLVG